MDLKFKNNAFFFSILGDFGGLTPILIPRISNPDFLDKETFMIKSAPGIKQLLDGDLGITEMIMMKVLDPVFNSVANNIHVAEVMAKQATPLDESNSDAIPQDDKSIIAKAKAVMLDNYIPKDNGLKALEKTIITTMMESHKPIFDFAKILMEMLGIAEDVVCRFLGTSIKIMGKEVGFPSRNPAYWEKSLGYAQTMSFSSKDFQTAFKLASNEFIKKMASTHPLKGVDDQSGSSVDDGDSRDAIYVGYFDENGNEVEPPLWVLNSNKWVKKDVLDTNNNNITVGSPFKRLSLELNEGVEQIRQYHLNAVAKLEKQKQEILDSLNKSISEIKDKEDVDHIESQKKQVNQEFDSLIQSVYDMIDGTNINGDNYIDDDDISKGVNPPVVLTEWISKTRASQLRQKYFPETVSTVQSLVDRKGEPIAPYTHIPKVKVNYRGKEVGVESPLAYTNQIEKKKVKDLDTFYDKKQGSLLNTYSERNIIKNYDVHYKTNKKKPYVEVDKTWFMHKDNDVYIPDALKNYYLPIEWEEVLEYEIRNKETGAVIRKEYETTTRKIDIENDYELRVIKVVNRALPLAPSEKLDNINTKNVKIDPLTGTIYNHGNNIPQVLIQEDNGKSPLLNLHSTPDINEKNLLKEGIIKHGLDPRFPKNKVFFLIEALKKDESGLVAINGKYNEADVAKAEKGDKNKGKKWYGLLDKFTALPMIAAKLLPLIGGKLIPLIIEILQLIQNPMKIKQMLLDLALDKKLSKFPINFPDFDKDKGVIGKVRKLYNEGFKVPERFEDDVKKIKDKAYYAGAQIDKKAVEIISMIDGQAVADFGKGIFDKPLFSFGVNIQTTNIDKPVDFISELQEGTKLQPIITMILNFIKLPFEVIFKIFMWVIKWVKKLLNPIKIPAAIAEFITFKWLRDIIGKDSLFKMLGMVEPNLDMMNKLIDAIKDKEILSNVIDSIRGGGKSVEVLVYDLFKNGVKVGTEIEERPYSSATSKQGNTNGNTNGNDKSNLLDIADLLAGLTGLLKGLCGEREFNLNDLLPIPFLGNMPDYNLCELPLLFLKPLELIGGILHIVQELLNALIAMPLSIFGLEPHIKIPKFGKEIPMFDKFEEMLQALRDSLTPPVVTG
jgi:hypothetical protein